MVRLTPDGALWRFLQCEHCGTSFVYLERPPEVASVPGEKLRIGAYACLSCGRMQSSMSPSSANVAKSAPGLICPDGKPPSDTVLAGILATSRGARQNLWEDPKEVNSTNAPLARTAMQTTSPNVPLPRSENSSPPRAQSGDTSVRRFDTASSPFHSHNSDPFRVGSSGSFSESPRPNDEPRTEKLGPSRLNKIGEAMWLIAGGLLWVWSILGYLAFFGFWGAVAGFVVPPLTYLFPLITIMVRGFDGNVIVMGILWLISIGGLVLWKGKSNFDNVQDL